MKVGQLNCFGRVDLYYSGFYCHLLYGFTTFKDRWHLSNFCNYSLWTYNGNSIRLEKPAGICLTAFFTSKHFFKFRKIHCN